MGLISISLLMLSAITPAAYAHSPQNMSLSYNMDNQTITSEITHLVNNNSNHYVKEIEIRNDNQLVKTETYDSQPSTSTFTYNISTSFEENDSIQAKAICNQGGNIVEEIKITGAGEEPISDGEEGGNSLIIFGIVIAAIIIVGAGIYYLR